MSGIRYIMTLVLLCIAQILINEYLFLSQYIVIDILPLLILSLPVRKDTNIALLVAFAAGLIVDFMSTGVLGLSSASLLLLALLRMPIISGIAGEEAFTRKDSAPVGHMSARTVFLVVLAGAIVFFTPYVFIDAAGTRPFWFNLSRLTLSSLLSAALMTFLNGFLFVEK